MKIKILLVFLSISLSGCVSLKKHSEAQAEFAKCKAFLQDLEESNQRQMHEKDQQIAELLQLIKELKAHIRKLESN